MSDLGFYVAPVSPSNLNVWLLGVAAGLAAARRNTVKIVAAAGTTLAGDCDEVRCNMTTGAYSVLLPAAPVDGDRYEFTKTDATGNVLTIDRNGKTIRGAASNVTISTQWNSLMLTWSTDDNTWWSR